MSVCKHQRLEKALQNIAAMFVFFPSSSTLPRSFHALKKPLVSYIFFTAVLKFEKRAMEVRVGLN
jgi:hypothetical protein